MQTFLGPVPSKSRQLKDSLAVDAAKQLRSWRTDRLIVLFEIRSFVNSEVKFVN